MKGIDISSHNTITNYSLLKGQIDFAIVRASWGFFQEDVKLKEHIKGLDSVGIPYGLYHYSYARNLDEAKKEVEGFINIAKGLNPTYPLVIDMEDADNWKTKNGNPSNDMYVQICEYFCKRIEEAGYYAMIYASKDWFVNRLNDSRLDRFDKWLAQWSNKPTYNKPFGIWQYTSDGHVDGINGRVDMNECYKDYPSIIKGTSKQEPVKKSNDEIAKEVLEGKWGNGEDRKNRLTNAGYNYSDVQAIVNKLCEKPKVQYLNISPNATYRSVYSDSTILKKIGEIKPQKFNGLTYKILGTYPNEVVKIHTATYGDVYISGKSKYYGTITNNPVYKNGSY